MSKDNKPLMVHHIVICKKTGEEIVIDDVGDGCNMCDHFKGTDYIVLECDYDEDKHGQ